MQIPLAQLSKISNEGLQIVETINRLEHDGTPRTTEEKVIRILLRALNETQTQYAEIVLRLVA